MDSGNSTFITPDGLAIHYQLLRNPKPKGVVLIVHGVGEHIGRYRALEEWFCESGYTCYGYDQRGHGLSNGRRTHVSGFSEYVAELHQITAEVQKREAGLPIFIYAHSMGALVGLLGVVSEPTLCRGLILTSPAVAMGSAIPNWLVKAGSMLAKFLPTMRVSSQIDAASLSHNAKIVSDYVNDPLVEGTVTLGWLSNMLAAQKAVLQTAPSITVPMLILHSRADTVTDIKGTHRLVEQLPQGKVTFHEYSEAYHELHNEVDTQGSVVLRDIEYWLKRQIET